MKLKKITLYYREMNEYESATPEEIGQLVVFRTNQGGYGIRRRCHGWKVGETVWTPDGKEQTTIIAVASPESLEDLLEVFWNATYIVNRFDNESDRAKYLNQLEQELLAKAA